MNTAPYILTANKKSSDFFVGGLKLGKIHSSLIII
jgi:hypothetical protein